MRHPQGFADDGIGTPQWNLSPETWPTFAELSSANLRPCVVLLRAESSHSVPKLLGYRWVSSSSAFCVDTCISRMGAPATTSTPSEAVRIVGSGVVICREMRGQDQRTCDTCVSRKVVFGQNPFCRCCAGLGGQFTDVRLPPPQPSRGAIYHLRPQICCTSTNLHAQTDGLLALP